MYNDHNVKPLHLMLSKTSAYVKSYDGHTKCMYFLTEGDDLLENYNATWDKVSIDTKKEFDGETIYNKKILKIKIKSHCDKVTDFMIAKFQRLTLFIFFSKN